MNEKVEKYLTEASLKDVPKDFMDDPLYKAVLMSKNEKEFKKALDTLLSIRGSNALNALKAAMKKMK